MIFTITNCFCLKQKNYYSKSSIKFYIKIYRKLYGRLKTNQKNLALVYEWPQANCWLLKTLSLTEWKKRKKRPKMDEKRICSFVKKVSCQRDIMIGYDKFCLKIWKKNRVNIISFNKEIPTQTWMGHLFHRNFLTNSVLGISAENQQNLGNLSNCSP